LGKKESAPKTKVGGKTFGGRKDCIHSPRKGQNQKCSPLAGCSVVRKEGDLKKVTTLGGPNGERYGNKEGEGEESGEEGYVSRLPPGPLKNQGRGSQKEKGG